MAILDNNPTLRYVSVKNMIIEFNKEKYAIANFYSNKKYFYWDASQPYQLIETNERKKEIGNRFLVILNDKGIHTLMPNDQYIVTFDGDNPDLIINSITSIYESLDGVGDRFTNVETDINGIRQTVGSSVEDDGSILQKVSILEQNDDKINLEVSKLEKDFADNKEVMELRENLNKSMIEFNSGLGIFKQDINTYFKDNKIDSEEKLKINTHLDMTDKSRSEVIKHVDIVINIMQSEGQTSQVNRLNSVKTKFLNSVKNLRTYITTAISDNTVVPSEISGTVDLFAKCNSSINELKNTCDECIFLGSGGKVVEELARIGLKSDEILLSVSKNENTIKNNLSIEKNLLQGDMDDFDEALDIVQDAIKKLTKDGSINDMGKEIISEKISLLDIEKSHIDNKYIEIYNNINISISSKDSLKIAYDLFNNKYEETKLLINNNLSDGFANEAELIQIETIINELRSTKTNLHPKMVQSMDDIQDNINKAELKAAKDELQGNINDVDNKVGDLDNYVNSTFENNILDETERKNIKSNLDNLQREKVDIDNQYTQLNNNKFLDGILKTNYTTSYNNFLSKYNSLVDVMNNILNKAELINNTDRENMNNGYKQLNESIGTFVRLSNEVIEYIAKKEAEYVKNVLNQDIIDVDNKITDLSDNINNSFKDNVIDESERKAIALNLKDLESQKIDVDNQYNQLILSTFLDGVLKAEFETKYLDFVAKYNALISVMNSMLAKEGLISDTDRNNMNTARDSFNLSIGEFSRIANRVIEYIGKKQSEGAVGDFSKQLDDLNKKVDGIMDDVGGALADNIIDETERIAIKQSLKELDKELIENEVEYQKIYNNINLIGDIKVQLSTAYNTYVIKHNNLVSTINSLLNKVGLIDDIDRKNMDNAYAEYGVAIRIYTDKLYEAIDSITNKGINDAKGEMNKELGDLSSSLTDLENTMNGVFKDSILSDAEKLAIEQNIKTLETEKADIDRSYSTVYNNKNLVGTQKSDLKSSYDLYSLEYDNLIKTIRDILVKTGLIDDTDKSKLNTAFSKHKIGLSNFREKYNAAIDSITNKSVSDAKELLQNEINDLNNALGDLENTMNNAFKDGVLSDAEKLAIKQNLQTISNEKTDVDKQFTAVYENPDLIGNAKVNLKNSYDAYVIKYNALVVIVNNILNKVGLVDSSDQNKLNNGFIEYRTTSGEYSKYVSQAVDSIAKKKADDAEQNVTKYTDAKIKILNDEINLKVSQNTYDKNNKIINEKFSEIDQTANDIKLTVSDVGTRADDAYTKASSFEQSINGLKQTVTAIEGDYVNTSAFEQTTQGWDFRFYESTNPNIMLNGGFEKYETYNRNHPFILDYTKGGGDTGYPATIDGGQALLLYTNGGDSYFEKPTSIKIKPNTSYIISYYYCCTHSRDDSNYIFVNNNPIRLRTTYTGDRSWHRASHVINIGSNVDAINKVRLGIIAQEQCWILFDNMQIEEMIGNNNTPSKYKPNSDEVCVNNSFIDTEGIGVKHKDGSYTKMIPEGFRRYVGSTGYSYHYLTYIGKTQKLNMNPVTVRLPDDFKGKEFKVTLSVEEIANPPGWFIQSFQVLVGNIDRINATFQILGGSQSQYHDGTQGTMKPTTVAYTVTA